MTERLVNMTGVGISSHSKFEITFSTEKMSGEHFFGYYDKSPFDASGRFFLGHRVMFKSNRMPKANDVADIVIFDLETQEARIIGQTHAFNFQQGSSLQWLAPDYSSRIIYNDYRSEQYVSVIYNIATKKETVLPLPIYSVSPNGNNAVCVNYDRLFWCRPGYSYACGGDPAFNCNIHPDDGISLLDLATGKYELIIRTSDMVNRKHVSSMDHGDNYLEHLLFSPSGKRFFFLHRWRTSDGDYYTRAYTAAQDGSDIRLLSDSGDISHYAWHNEQNIMVFGSETAGINRLRQSQWIVQYILKPFLPLFKMIVRPGGRLEKNVLPYRYHLINALTGRRASVGNRKLTTDGHPSFNPVNNNIFISDTYPDAEHLRHLYLYDMDKNDKNEIGGFYSSYDDGGYRCDLHPRWDRQGIRACIDSTHEGSRQIYIIGGLSTRLL